MKKITIMIGVFVLAASIGITRASDTPPPKATDSAPGAVTAAQKAGAVDPKRTEATEQKGKQCDGPQNQNKVRTSR